MFKTILAALIVVGFCIYSLMEPENKTCSDYLLVGSTSDRCLTDKRIEE